MTKSDISKFQNRAQFFMAQEIICSHVYTSGIFLEVCVRNLCLISLVVSDILCFATRLVTCD